MVMQKNSVLKTPVMVGVTADKTKTPKVELATLGVDCVGSATQTAQRVDAGCQHWRSDQGVQDPARPSSPRLIKTPYCPAHSPAMLELRLTENESYGGREASLLSHAARNMADGVTYGLRGLDKGAR